MKRIHLLIICTIGIALSCSAVYAIGKQTVDPNASGKPPADSTSVGKQTTDPNAAPKPLVSMVDVAYDTGLTKKITYSAHGKMLYLIVDDLAKLSDSKFFTGRGTADWRTRELRMNIEAKEVPLQDLMNSIARVQKLIWLRAPTNGKQMYRLMSERTTPTETPEQRAARELSRRRGGFFTAYMGLAYANAAEIEKTKQVNPELYKLAKQPYGAAVAKFLASTPGASMALMTGKSITLRANDVPATAVNDLLRAFAPQPGINIQRPGQPIPPPQPMASAETLVVEINPNAQGANSGLGEMKISYGGREVPIKFTDGGSVVAQDQADASQAEKPKPEVKPDPDANHPDEPDLHKNVKLQIKSPATLEAMETALAEATGFAVVSDCYEGKSVTVDVPKDEMQLMYLLDKMLNPIEFNWEKHAGVIEIRDRNWQTKRADMSPQAEKGK